MPSQSLSTIYIMPPILLLLLKRPAILFFQAIMLLIPLIKSLLVLVSLLDTWNLADCYDPLDPNGNITVTFDILYWTSDGYKARVSIQNYYQYRHIKKPGWILGWEWVQGEVIWSMSGALAVQQGNCSEFKSQVPYCCKKDLAIIDLMPDALPENWTAHCCRGGILSSWGIEPANSVSIFDILVGNLDNKGKARQPSNVTLLVSPDYGYTCGPMVDSLPTVVPVVGGRREEQAFKTWKSVCTYSTFVAKKFPACCVSLSAFYNPKVMPCQKCSCGCPSSGNTTQVCIGDNEMKRLAGDILHENKVGCTDHMCSIRVHWHIKSNYRDHWRVKVTVSNYNFASNYSDWNLVVQHPNFNQGTLVYSFNSTKLPTVGNMDEAAIFWGLEFFNKMLLQAGEIEPGSVTTDLIIRKDPESFTLSNGWAFPRRVYFNGDNCEMPMPDDFPALPNTSSGPPVGHHLLFLLLTLMFLFH